MRACLRSYRKSFVNCIFYYLCHHRMAHMTDMDASSRCSCHINNIFCSNVFCPYVVRVKECTDLFFSAQSFFCFRFFFPLKHLSVFFAVESAQCIIRFQNFKCFSDISHVNGRKQIAVRACKSFECRNTAFMQVNQIVHIILYRIRFIIIVSYNSSPESKIHC